MTSWRPAGNHVGRKIVVAAAPAPCLMLANTRIWQRMLVSVASLCDDVSDHDADISVSIWGSTFHKHALFHFDTRAEMTSCVDRAQNRVKSKLDEAGGLA